MSKAAEGEVRAAAIIIAAGVFDDEAQTFRRPLQQMLRQESADFAEQGRPLFRLIAVERLKPDLA